MGDNPIDVSRHNRAGRAPNRTPYQVATRCTRGRRAAEPQFSPAHLTLTPVTGEGILQEPPLPQRISILFTQLMVGR